VPGDGEDRGQRGVPAAGTQHGTVDEPALGLVGADLDRDLATDAVRLADPADADLDVAHVRQCPSARSGT
jgi:hypothetical protein